SALALRSDVALGVAAALDFAEASAFAARLATRLGPCEGGRLEHLIDRVDPQAALLDAGLDDGCITHSELVAARRETDRPAVDRLRLPKHTRHILVDVVGDDVCTQETNELLAVFRAHQLVLAQAGHLLPC